MSEIQVAFFRSKADPTTFAVSPDRNGLVFPNPEEWEFERTETINPTLVLRDSELALWLEAFKRDGYCIFTAQR
ncbi:MAG: hypothetical protein P4L80_17320 [Xanthobacteraceae bacterium]|nr:hypothetical protein [Xanthobacteraceae bacterium]